MLLSVRMRESSPEQQANRMRRCFHRAPRVYFASDAPALRLELYFRGPYESAGFRVSGACPDVAPKNII
jgi:hypothetical protein